jgi:hypothetical protein
MRKMLMISVLAAMALAGCGGGGGKKIGIAACDQFIEKEKACGDKIGGDQGSSLKKQADMMLDAWMKDKDDKNAAGSLESTCKSAIDDASKAFAQCDWK